MVPQPGLFDLGLSPPEFCGKSGFPDHVPSESLYFSLRFVKRPSSPTPPRQRSSKWKILVFVGGAFLPSENLTQALAPHVCGFFLSPTLIPLFWVLSLLIPAFRSPPIALLFPCCEKLAVTLLQFFPRTSSPHVVCLLSPKRKPFFSDCPILGGFFWFAYR